MTENALRQAAQNAYDFLQDKSFIPDSETHRCTAIVAELEAALDGRPIDGETKLVYVKRWRTLVRLPAKHADEIVDALRAPAE